MLHQGNTGYKPISLYNKVVLKLELWKQYLPIAKWPDIQDQRNITPPCLSIRVTTERPAAATDSQALWFLHNSPHYERFMQQPPV
ncbi:hypothetical protein AVEN_53986-1, partial [Araneus ventricosus]